MPDHPSEALLAERLAKIALHEIGHCFGLDHHTYDEEIDCLMVGDAEVDCTGEVDLGGIRFCKQCLTGIRKKLRRYERGFGADSEHRLSANGVSTDRHIHKKQKHPCGW